MISQPDFPQPITHPIPPVFDRHARILILGSFPSVKSRAEGFFYGHPQNRFWRVLASIYQTETPESIDEKRIFLLSHQIALWDVIASCEIEGSADATLRHVIPNDLRPILNTAPIEHVFLNGRAAQSLYESHMAPLFPDLARTALPSTSPANAVWRLDRLIEAWRVILEV